MRYTLTLDLCNLPLWARDLVVATLDEYEAVWTTHWSEGLYDVTSRDKDRVETACTEALARIGRRLDDVVVDLLA